MSIEETLPIEESENKQTLLELDDGTGGMDENLGDFLKTHPDPSDEVEEKTEETQETEETEDKAEVVETETPKDEPVTLEDISGGYPKPEGWNPEELEGVAKDVHDYWRRALTVKGQETAARIKEIQEQFEGIDPAEAKRQTDIVNKIVGSDYYEVVEALIDPNNKFHNQVVALISGQEGSGGGGNEKSDIDKLIDMEPKEILEACVDEDGNIDIESYDKMIKARDEGIARLGFEYARGQAPVQSQTKPDGRPFWETFKQEKGLTDEDQAVYEAEYQALKKDADQMPLAEVRRLQSDPRALAEHIHERVLAKRQGEMERLQAAKEVEKQRNATTKPAGNVSSTTPTVSEEEGLGDFLKRRFG